MVENGQFTTHGSPLYDLQPLVAVFRYLGGAQSVERNPSDWMPENDPQHVKLAVASELSGHDCAPIAFQQISKRVGTEQAGVHGQLASFNFGFLLPCP
jgi:hypothetical protein